MKQVAVPNPPAPWCFVPFVPLRGHSCGGIQVEKCCGIRRIPAGQFRGGAAAGLQHRRRPAGSVRMRLPAFDYKICLDSGPGIANIRPHIGSRVPHSEGPGSVTHEPHTPLQRTPASAHRPDRHAGGWVHSRRDLGGVIFIDIRDREGRTQTVFDRPTLPEEVFDQAAAFRNESVVRVSGRVRQRPEGTKNPRSRPARSRSGPANSRCSTWPKCCRSRWTIPRPPPR